MGDGDFRYKDFISIIIFITITITIIILILILILIIIIIIIIIITIITITVNTVFKMETSFPGSLKAEQDVNFAPLTTHVLLPIFPERSWVLERIRIRVDLENFDSGKKKPFP